jgi:hypothetical protein
VTFFRLGAPAALLLLFTGTSAQALEGSLTLRVKADDDRIEFFHRGKRLTDAQLNQLCAAAKARKAEIEFQRDKMTRDNALASILREAQCLGATHIGFTGIDRYPEPRSAPHKRARPRHRGAAPR